MGLTKEERTEIRLFFMELLEKIQNPVYYENLRGHVSKGSTVVKNYVRKECKGEKFLEYFIRKKEYFVVNNGEISLRNKDKNCNEVSFYDKDFKLHDDDKCQKISFEDWQSINKDLRKFRRNSSAVSSVAGIDEDAEEEMRYKDYTIKYFKSVLEQKKQIHVDDVDYEALSKKITKYLKTYLKTKSIKTFFQKFDDIFIINNDGFVSLVSVLPAPLPKNDENVNLNSCSVEEIVAVEPEHLDPDVKKVENFLSCIKFFTDIIEKKTSPCLVDKLSGYLSHASKDIQFYLKYNYHNFKDLFYDTPLIFNVNKYDEISLLKDYKKKIKEIEKLVRKAYKRPSSHMPLMSQVKSRLCSPPSVIMNGGPELGMASTLEIKNLEQCVTYGNGSVNEVDCRGLEVLGRSLESAILVSNKAITENEHLNDNFSQKENAKALIECKELSFANKELHELDSKPEKLYTKNIICTERQAVLKKFLDKTPGFKNTENYNKDIDNKIACENEFEKYDAYEKELYVKVKLAVELLCLIMVYEERRLSTIYEGKAVKYFTELLEKNQYNFCSISSLQGKLGEVSGDICSYMNRQYKGEKFCLFFKGHEEFIVKSSTVELSCAYKELKNSPSQHVQENSKTAIESLLNLFDIPRFKEYLKEICGFLVDISKLLLKKGSAKIDNLICIVPQYPLCFIWIKSLEGSAMSVKMKLFLDSLKIFEIKEELYIVYNSDYQNVLKDASTFFYEMFSKKIFMNFNLEVNSLSGKQNVVTNSIIDQIKMTLNERSYVKLNELPEILPSSVLGIIPIGKCSQYLISVIEESNLFVLENGEIKFEAKQGLLTNACNVCSESEKLDWSEIGMIKSDVETTENKSSYEVEVNGEMLMSICDTNNKENVSIKDSGVKNGSETPVDTNEDKISNETRTNLSMLTNAHDYSKEKGMAIKIHLIKCDSETSLEINKKETSFKTEANQVILSTAYANNPGEDMLINDCALKNDSETSINKNDNETSIKNSENRPLYETEADQRMLNSESFNSKHENASVKDSAVENANEASFEINKDKIFYEIVVEKDMLTNSCDNKGDNISLRDCLIKNGSHESKLFYNIEINQGKLSNAYDNSTKKTASLEGNVIKSSSDNYIEIDENKISCSNIEADQSTLDNACDKSQEGNMSIEDCAVKTSDSNSSAVNESKVPAHTSGEVNCSTFKSDLRNPDSFSRNALMPETFKTTTVDSSKCPYEAGNNRQLEEHFRMCVGETENSKLSTSEFREGASCLDSSDESSIVENIRNLYEEEESELRNMYLVKDCSPKDSNSFNAVLKKFKFNAPLSSAFSTSVDSTFERNNDILVNQKKYEENALCMDEGSKAFNRNANLNLHTTGNFQNVNNHAHDFLQPIIGRIILLTTDSCIAVADVNGNKQHIYGLKSLFHCDKHEYSSDCFSALCLDDEVSCYIHFSEFSSEVWMAFMMSSECHHGIGEENLKDAEAQNCQSHVPDQFQLNCVRNEKENNSNGITNFFDGSMQNETVSFHNGYKIHLIDDAKSSIDTVEASCQNYCDFCEESSQTEILSYNAGCQTYLRDDDKLWIAMNEVSCQICPDFCDEILQTEILSLTCDCQTDPFDQINSTEVSCETVFIQSTVDASVQTSFRVQDCICQTDVSDDIMADTQALKTPQTANSGCQTIATGDIMIKMYYHE